VVEYREHRHGDGSKSWTCYGVVGETEAKQIICVFPTQCAVLPKWLWHKWVPNSRHHLSQYQTWLTFDGKPVEVHLDERENAQLRIFNAVHIFQCPGCLAFVPIVHDQTDCNEMQVMEIQLA
jgi:hypothetical protein